MSTNAETASIGSTSGGGSWLAASGSCSAIALLSSKVVVTTKKMISVNTTSISEVRLISGSSR